MQSTKEPLFAGGSTPVSRYGHGSEIADVVAWLASPSASYVTGAELLVDGGVAALLPEVATGSLRWTKSLESIS